jgi:hypothetical protein
VWKFDTFWVTSSSRGIAENWAIILCASCERCWTFFFLTSFNYGFKLIKFYAYCSTLINIFSSNVIKTNQEFYCLGKIFFFHLDNLWNIFMSSKNTWKFSLLQNIINSLESHWVKETNSGLIVVHISNMCCKPLPTIFWPDTDKTPILTIPWSLRNKVKFFHASC